MPSPSTINKFLMKARDASYESDFPRQHLGSILVYGNKILAIGYNTLKTSPNQLFYNKYRKFNDYVAKNCGANHAEMTVLLKTKYLDINWSKATLYIYREHKNGKIVLSKPCKGCMRAIKDRGIGTVIYTNEFGGYTIMKLKESHYEII